MRNRHPSWFAAGAAGIAVVLTLALGPSAAPAAPRDRTPPTKPTNLHVTGLTAWSVSLAWNPSTDNSGQFSYVVKCSNGHSVTVPKEYTYVTFTSGFQHRWMYSFYVYAIDGSGNKSANSNTVTVTLPQDTTPPTKPAVTVTAVGPTSVGLAWSSTDDGPFIFYNVYQDGVPVLNATSATSGTIYLLEPNTTYTFTVQARDNGINWSALSDPVVVTTAASDPNDTTPPTAPGNLRTNGMEFGEEIWLFWDQSHDNVTPDEFIRYDVYLNGVLDHSTTLEQTVFYVTPGVLNQIDVVAVDAAGNASAPATIFIDLR